MIGLIEEGEDDLKELLRRQQVNRNNLLNALKAIRGSSGSPARTRRPTTRPWSAMAAT